jgi:heme oxygenase
MVIPPVLTLPKSALRAEPVSLSQRLRSGTELAHKDVERRLGLPGSIADLTDYRRCLLRFYELYRPLETQFERFGDWTDLGLDVPNGALSTRLAADLRALGVSVPEVGDGAAASLPALRTFAQALGACYVIEGSALGSQFMMPQLQKTLGEGMSGADSFFRGRGAETGAFWKGFRAGLDWYGETHPEQTVCVVESAIATFEAIGLWMQP